jgi:hypothetical protein
MAHRRGFRRCRHGTAKRRGVGDKSREHTVVIAAVVSGGYQQGDGLLYGAGARDPWLCNSCDRVHKNGDDIKWMGVDDHASLACGAAMKKMAKWVLKAPLLG